jgi:hypothetical protein
MTIARQQHGKHVSIATNKHATVGHGVFYVVHALAMQLGPAGGVEYLLRSSVSRRR